MTKPSGASESFAAATEIARRDISADARQWLEERRGRVQTHHNSCHMRTGHETCLVERLLGRLALAERERDSLRVAVENLAAHARTITLTDAEREVLGRLAERLSDWNMDDAEDVVRGILGRFK